MSFHKHHSLCFDFKEADLWRQRWAELLDFKARQKDDWEIEVSLIIQSQSLEMLLLPD